MWGALVSGLSFLAMAVLPPDTLILTHATRRYQAHADVIQATQDLVTRAQAQGRTVIALGDKPVDSDPLWYGGAFRTAAFPSSHGEHALVPSSIGSRSAVELAGGYHCACLAKTLAGLVRSFLDKTSGTEFEVHLPMRAIYTGYLLSPEGHRLPETPWEEANADDSIDGLSLDQVTRSMSDAEWAEFMRESLRVSLFAKSELVSLDLEEVRLEVYRDGRLLFSIGKGVARVVRLRYAS